MYFQKIRAFSDFALEIPYNPEKIEKDMQTVTENLSDASFASLDTQMQNFEEDCLKYCGKLYFRYQSKKMLRRILKGFNRASFFIIFNIHFPIIYFPTRIMDNIPGPVCAPIIGDNIVRLTMTS